MNKTQTKRLFKAIEEGDEATVLAILDDAPDDPNTGLWPALHGFGGIVNRADLIRLALDRGADPDRQVGNSSNTVRELVEFNAHLYSPEVLALFSIEPEVARGESSLPIEPPFMEHPSGDNANAEAALIEAMERLDGLGEVDRWINFSGQGRGQTDETYVVRDVAYRNGILDFKVSDREWAGYGRVWDFLGIKFNATMTSDLISLDSRRPSVELS